MDKIKFEVETKFKMAEIANLVGWRHKSRDSTSCNWNTWHYWQFFFYYYQHHCRVNSLCQITERLLFIRISTEPSKRLLDHHTFCHTHHWSHRLSIVVRLQPNRSAGRIYKYEFNRCYLYSCVQIIITCFIGGLARSNWIWFQTTLDFWIHCMNCDITWKLTIFQ